MAADEYVTIRLRLQDVAAFVAGTEEATAATERLGVSTATTGRDMERTSKRSFLWQQALFTMRRLLYMTTLATVALGGEAVRMGYNFTTGMQTARVAMRNFLPSAQAVNNELNMLFRFAAYTPYQFLDLTNSTRRLLAFRISLRDTNGLIFNLTDMLSAMGQTSPASLNRVVVALGHMYSVGHLTGQMLNQLARDNLAIAPILERQLGVTGARLYQMVRAGQISAETAIQLINRGIAGDPRFHGAARRLAESTLHGQLTTFRDYVSQIMGSIEQRPIMRASSFFPRLNRSLAGGAAAFQRGGMTGLFSHIDEGMGAGGKIVSTFRDIRNIANSVWTILTRGVIPAFRTAWSVVGGGAGPLHLIAGILGYVAGNATILRWGLVPLIAAMTAWKIVILANSAALKANLAWEWLSNEENIRGKRIAELSLLWTRMKTAATWLDTGAMTAAVWIQNTFTLANLRSIGAMVAWRAAIIAGTAVTWLWNAALDANPFVLLAVAIVGAAILIYTHFDQVKRGAIWMWKEIKGGAMDVWNWLKSHWRLLVEILTYPFAGPLAFIIFHWQAIEHFFESVPGRMARIGRGMWDWIWNEFRYVINLLIRGWNSLRFTMPTISTHIPGVGKIGGWSVGVPRIPYLASGGVVVGSGAAFIADRGPELVNLPRGATVAPLPVDTGVGAADDGGPVTLQPIYLMLDGQIIAEYTARYESDLLARR